MSLQDTGSSGHYSRIWAAGLGTPSNSPFRNGRGVSFHQPPPTARGCALGQEAGREHHHLGLKSPRLQRPHRGASQNRDPRGASPCTCWGLHSGSATQRPRHHHRVDLDMWASAQARRAVSPASTPAGIAELQPWHGVAAARDRQAEGEPSPGGRSEAAGAQVHRACPALPFASAGEQEQGRWAHSLTDPGVTLQLPPPPLLHIPRNASVPPYK